MTIWELAHQHRLSYDKKAVLMGILNVTPDSFSDGGYYCDVQAAARKSCQMLDDGAAIIDVGGESTKPGAATVSESIEQQRILPIIQHIRDKFDCLISVDTYNASTADLALRSGAHIINDVFGLQRDPAMAEVAASYGAGLVIMHTGRYRECLDDVIEDQKYFFDKSLTIANKAGIQDKHVVLDPGFGFAKNFQQNLSLLKRASELKSFGFPLLAGTSRKRFLGSVCDQQEATQRDIATAATSVLLRQAGFIIFRVHNVGVNREALSVVDAAMAAE